MVGKISAEASYASKLANPRNINGVPFDGSVDIDIVDASKLPLTGGTLTGPLTLPSVGTSWINGTGGNSALKLPPSSAFSWHPWISQRTSAGNAWAMGQLGEVWSLSYAAKGNIDSNTNTTTQVLSADLNGITVNGNTIMNGGLYSYGPTNLPMLGVDQTWKDVTALRAVDTVYWNTTGRPIIIAAGATGRDATCQITVNGLLVHLSTDIYDGNGNKSSGMAVVPNGSYYRISLWNKYGTAVHFISELS